MAAITAGDVHFHDGSFPTVFWPATDQTLPIVSPDRFISSRLTFETTNNHHRGRERSRRRCHTQRRSTPPFLLFPGQPLAELYRSSPPAAPPGCPLPILIGGDPGRSVVGVFLRWAPPPPFGPFTRFVFACPLLSPPASVSVCRVLHKSTGPCPSPCPSA